MELILSTLISNQSTPAGSFAVKHRPYEGTLIDSAMPDHNGCRFQIDRVVRDIKVPEVRNVVGTVFQDLLRLLECLTLVENHLRRVDAAEETFALFQIIRDEAGLLVDFIQQEGLDCTAMSEDLADTLDGISFAVSHDLQSVFETSQSGTTWAEASQLSDAHVVVSQMYRAHDMLTNCLQQSTISLAIMFDPELAGTKLFDNSDSRFRQSLQLCQDLSLLIQLVEAAEKECVEAPLKGLTAGIEKFRNESMECLMYSDWPQFEDFCEQIKLTMTPELESVLHQFRCYLETLLGQVRMRAVLSDVFPIQFGPGDDIQLPAVGDECPSEFPSAFDRREKNAA